jgi:polygalacturonase
MKNVKLDYDVTGDGRTVDTKAIREAIAACQESGGGTLYFPPGEYLTAPLELCDNLTLHFEAGATLRFSQNIDDYPAAFVRWEGCECVGYSPCIYGNGLKNVTLEGRGILDGSGTVWWTELHRRKKEGLKGPQTPMEHEFARQNVGYESAGSGGGGRETQFLRPCLIEMLHCENVRLSGITVQNSGFWNTHLVYCENVVVDGVSIRNPSDTPNGDGLSLDSCRNVRVVNCLFDTGDDCLTLKSGIDADGRRVNRPTEDVLISNCLFMRGHGGVVLGSELSGGIRRVLVSNCIFKGTDRGLRIKARRGRGGYARDIRLSNCHFEDTLCPFVINARYGCGAWDDPVASDPEPRPVDETTPHFSGIHISQCTARGCVAAAMWVSGLPEAPVENLHLSDLLLETVSGEGPPSAAAMAYGAEKTRGAGLILSEIKDLQKHNVVVRVRK